MLYSDLPEYKLSYRDLRGGAGEKATTRPAAAAAPPMPDWMKQQPGTSMTSRITSAAPHLVDAAGAMAKTSGSIQNQDWLSALGSLSKAAGAGVGGATAGKLGNLGAVATGMMAKDQQRANAGQQIARIMKEYANDPAARRDALTAFLATQKTETP